MFANLFGRSGNPHALAVSMTGVKMGDLVAFIGCAHGGRLAATAAKVGLSGRAIAVVPDAAAAARARSGAADAGILVEVEIAPPTTLPLEDNSIDLAVVDDTGRLLDGMRPEERAATVRELARILRPGGRAIVLGAMMRSGVAALLWSRHQGSFTASGGANAALAADIFRSVRTLAERDGLVFIEGLKPREAR